MITVIGTLKGGSGKSTVAFNLGIWLATQQQNVQLVDLDPQNTLTDVLEVRQEEGISPQVENTSQWSFSNRADVEILVDVGTADMDAMKKALSIADRIVVPVAPSQADIWSTQRFLLIIAAMIKEKPPQILAFINRADTHKAIRETNEAEQALKMLPGIYVLDAKLSQRTAFRRSFSEGLGVFELEPRSKAAQELQNLAQSLYPKLP